MYQVTDDSTQHGLSTPHGFGTPHKYPRKTNTPVDFFKMVSLLYPTGRAWYLPELLNFSQLHAAINQSLVQLSVDAQGVLDSYFPDNANFDASDATLWESRLGIDYNPALTLDQRRVNILLKLSFPQNIKARQHPLYIEDRLNKAGFNVKIYENKFFDGSGNLYQKTPAEVLGLTNTITQFGGGTQFGGSTQFGGGGYGVVANNETQEDYSTGGNLWATFFIAGDTIGTTASVPAFREREFRRLVLSLKPAHTVAYLFVNFT